MDLDSFFVSVSCLMHPELKGKPVIVGGTSDRGVVASCSYEARKFGIHAAMPTKLVKRLCPEAIFIRGDYDKYTEYSDIVSQIIKEQVPLYEKASIDEFYIDLTGMDKFFGCYKWATELRQRIIRETGLPISFGLSKNKTVSKVATGEAKPNNQMYVNYGTEKSFLAPMPVSKIPMVGEKTTALLRSMGVEKVKTIQDMPVELMQNVLGENGLIIWRKANGIDNTAVEPYNERKSISTEETFDSDTIDVQMLKALLVKMTEKLAFQLRCEKKLTACIAVKIRYANFDTHTTQVRIAHTCADHLLISGVKQLFDKLYQRRMLVRLIGVRFSHLLNGAHQINLFEDSAHLLALYQTMDNLRKNYGSHAIMRAVGSAKSLRTFNPFNGISNSLSSAAPDAAQPQFVLAINPPKHVHNEIKKQQQNAINIHPYLASQKNYGHLMLMQFKAPQQQQQAIIDAVQQVCALQTPIPIILQTYMHHNKQNIYLPVQKVNTLTQLVKSLQAQLQLPHHQTYVAYNPCINVISGLTQNVFDTVFQHFEHVNYNTTFIADTLMLLTRTSAYEPYTLIHEFDFNNMQTVPVIN